MKCNQPDDAATPNYRLFRNRIQLCREMYVPRFQGLLSTTFFAFSNELNSEFEKKKGKKREEGGKRRGEKKMNRSLDNSWLEGRI